LDEDEEYDRFYRRLQHFDGLIIRICANNYTMLYQPETYDWFWRSTAPIVDKDVDAETAKTQTEDAAKEKAALREKRHDRFVEKFVNNPNWARGLSKDKVDESNQRFRSWLNGNLSAENAVSATEEPEKPTEDKESEKDKTPPKEDQPDAEMADAAPPAPEAEAETTEAQ
jgi:paired amphipathic helix protein Sin3a